MICVLRIGGIRMNTDLVRQALSLEPYRIDVRGTDGARVNCLHYDVIDETGGGSGEIYEFLSTRSAELKSVTRLEGIEFRNLDIGLMLYDDRVPVSFELDEKLILTLSELCLSVSVSTYPTSASS